MMADPNIEAAPQPAPAKFSRYRSIREKRDADGTNEEVAHPVTNHTEPDQQNPSIARSMSRYRRNRPSINGPSISASKVPPTPTLSDHAQSQRLSALSGSIRDKQAAREEEERQRHRQNAMDQLTGGDQMSHSIRLRPKHSSSGRLIQESQARDSGREGQTSATALSSDGTRKTFLQKAGLTKSKASTQQEQPPPRYIVAGGGGIVPGTDAPVSAVNAGERRVTVQYGDISAELPVTPSTRVQDILLSASRKLSRDICPEKSILIESFLQVGLERPLRRYERVRDVMNSWAHDADNRLIIIPPSSEEALAQLDAQQAPNEKPAETSGYLYHSQRPGKWDKRYVTLRVDGQIVISKKESSTSHINICHLSDFDVYSPTARALAKEIKPPKKICIAIKSQEKSSMFLSTEKYMHFFSTNDRSVADQWHRVVQAWRSWYLISQMGANTQAEADQVPEMRSMLDRHGSRVGQRTNSHEALSRKRSVREHAPAPTSISKTLTIDTGVGQGHLVKSMSTEEMDATTFSPAGLLGRTYTQRRQAMREKEEREKRAMQDPFPGYGLLGETPIYSPSYASTSQNDTRTQAPNALSRGLSIKQQQKPLVDLTPVFHEPPQHTRKGRGVTVESGPLIEAATSPELAPGAISIPPATAWQRPSTDVDHKTQRRSNTIRSIRHAPPSKSSRANSAEASPTLRSEPFQPNSLLGASSWQPNQGKVSTGHGVATGDRNATRPMLDVSPENPFAEGSLLRQL